MQDERSLHVLKLLLIRAGSLPLPQGKASNICIALSRAYLSGKQSYYFHDSTCFQIRWYHELEATSIFSPSCPLLKYMKLNRK